MGERQTRKKEGEVEGQGAQKRQAQEKRQSEREREKTWGGSLIEAHFSGRGHSPRPFMGL